MAARDDAAAGQAMGGGQAAIAIRGDQTIEQKPARIAILPRISDR
jgi:hypothetical protein